MTEPDGRPETEHCVLTHPVDRPADAYIGLVCRRHYGYIDRMLTEIEELSALAETMHQPGAAPESDGSKHGKQPYAPAPGRLDIAALTDPRAETRDGWNADDGTIPNVAQVLYGWVRMILEERVVVEPETVEVSPLVRFLKRERHWIANQYWVDSYAAELHEVHRVLARVTGAGLWPESIGKCINCAAPLYLTVGVDVISCKRCKSSWEGVHLMRLRLILEQQQEAKRA